MLRACRGARLVNPLCSSSTTMLWTLGGDAYLTKPPSFPRSTSGTSKETPAKLESTGSSRLIVCA